MSEGKNMISDEALEAACRAMFSDWDRNGDEWWRGMTRKRLHKALTAAVPHMLDEAKAYAWDAGARVRRDEHGDLMADNPYR